MAARPRFLLLQVRNGDDPMRKQEVDCFARALCGENSDAGSEAITVFDLLSGAPDAAAIKAADIVLLGGSGDHSVVRGGLWLEPALDAMRRLVDTRKPTFASCWGFQAMAKALGGTVVHDMARAELGTLPATATAAALTDAVFGPLGEVYDIPIGHEDTVDTLPPGVTLLASSQRVAHQAFRIDGAPIYCTQFHPELDRKAFLERVYAYPRYVESYSGLSVEAFAATCRETPQVGTLLRRFVDVVG